MNTLSLNSNPSPETITESQIEMAKLRAQMNARAQMRPQILAEGQAALYRLMPITERNTGQSGIVARFLMGMYNGQRFPFNLIELRGLDHSLHDDCLSVLRMDRLRTQDVHCYLKDGVQLFERLIANWYPQGGQLDK